jgi:hypothetical protein
MQDLREERGKAIAENGNVKKVNDHSFKVKSQSGRGVYEVKATPNGMTCTCPDFVYRGGKCKHIQATRYYLEIEKDTPQGTVTEKVHLTYAQAWNAYNEAQKAEVKLFDELLKDLVKAIPEPEQTRGRPRLSLQETLFCSIQKVYSQLSSRRAHSLFQNAVERGHGTGNRWPETHLTALLGVGCQDCPRARRSVRDMQSQSQPAKCSPT